MVGLGNFMSRYQILRNLSYACKFPDSMLFFVVLVLMKVSVML